MCGFGFRAVTASPRSSKRRVCHKRDASVLNRTMYVERNVMSGICTSVQLMRALRCDAHRQVDAQIEPGHKPFAWATPALNTSGLMLSIPRRPHGLLSSGGRAGLGGSFSCVARPFRPGRTTCCEKVKDITCLPYLTFFVIMFFINITTTSVITSSAASQSIPPLSSYLKSRTDSPS